MRIGAAHCRAPIAGPYDRGLMRGTNFSTSIDLSSLAIAISSTTTDRRQYSRQRKPALKEAEMGLCNVCGCFAIGTTTCNLCAIGKTPVNKSVEELAKTVGDRHRIPDPNLFPDLWVEVLIQKRVVDLFRSLPGLSGHWEQIQASVNSTARSLHFWDGGKTTNTGRDRYARLAIAIINVADDAPFDFPMMQLRFNHHDVGYLKISKSSTKLVVHSKPSGSIKLRPGISTG